MNKVSGDDGIPVELFKLLKDDAIKYASICHMSLHSTCHHIWKIQTVTTGLEKVSFHYNPKEGQCQRKFKLLHNCTHFTS